MYSAILTIVKDKNKGVMLLVKMKREGVRKGGDWRTPRNSTAKRMKCGGRKRENNRERETRAKADGELSANCIYHCYFKDALGIVPSA